MAATTSAAIRDVLIAAVKALTPATLGHVPFKAHDQRSIVGTEFQVWCDKNPTGAFRRFSITDDGNEQPVGASNTDVDRVTLEMEVTIAYPRDHRYGAQQKLDAFDVMKSDLNQLSYAVGYRAFATLDAANATVLEPERTRRVEGDACFFTVITVPFEFWRARPA